MAPTTFKWLDIQANGGDGAELVVECASSNIQWKALRCSSWVTVRRRMRTSKQRVCQIARFTSPNLWRNRSTFLVLHVSIGPAEPEEFFASRVGRMEMSLCVAHSCLDSLWFLALAMGNRRAFQTGKGHPQKPFPSHERECRRVPMHCDRGTGANAHQSICEAEQRREMINSVIVTLFASNCIGGGCLIQTGDVDRGTKPRNQLDDRTASQWHGSIRSASESANSHLSSGYPTCLPNGTHCAPRGH